MLLAIVLLASGCDAAANDPNEAGGQQGYPEVGRNLTQIPPEQRRPAPELSGPALGGGPALSSTAYPGKVVVRNLRVIERATAVDTASPDNSASMPSRHGVRQALKP